MPHALLLKYPGTNCDVETARALNAAGFSTQVQPIATATPAHVAKAQLVVFSGGFSYGDYVMSGRLAQLETERFLGDALQKHHANGGFLFGICNGFQLTAKVCFQRAVVQPAQVVFPVIHIISPFLPR